MTNENPGASRAAYYEQIARERMTPLWESLHSPSFRKPLSRKRGVRSGNTRRCEIS